MTVIGVEASPAVERARTAASDLWVALLALSPAELAEALPSLSNTWCLDEGRVLEQLEDDAACLALYGKAAPVGVIEP